MSDYRSLLRTELSRLQVHISSEQEAKLTRYCQELERWNKSINLTSLNQENLVRRLVAEPVWIAKQLGPKGVLLDIGSGNGSPALPIRVVSELTTTHLVEARTKRASFLRHVVSALGLTGVEIHRDRFEDIASTISSVDWVTLQAVALTAKLIEHMRVISNKTTTVVWITAGAKPPIDPTGRFVLPATRTEVLLFRLDQS